MSYSHIVSSNFVSVMNLLTGSVTKIYKDDAAFDNAVELIKAGDFESVEKLTVKEQIKNINSTMTGDFSVWIADGNVNYQYKSGESKVLHNAMTDRMLRMAAEGFNMEPLMKFMGNLLANPSKTAIDELYLFLEATELPITDDGHFIAYKIVRNDYTSHFDQKFMNAVGTVVEMPRSEVCDNRNLTCSHGLHFCSKEYLRYYGSTGTNDDRLVLVKINPADVVSIPSDYNNAKGRASKYLIWKDITEENWRDKYCHQDYNDVSVEFTFDKEDGTDDEISFDHVCDNCGSGHLIKKGTVVRYGETYQRYKCLSCGQNQYGDM